MERLKTVQVRIGDSLSIGSDSPVVIQTMCNTHTSDEQATVDQCLRLAAAGSQLVRITVPGMQDIAHLRNIHERLRALGCTVPLVADIHFSSEIGVL